MQYTFVESINHIRVMRKSYLTIVAKILVKEEKRDFVKTELIKLIATTRGEVGNINYDLHQDNENPNLFLFHENWVSRDLWQAHMQADHIVAFQKAVEGAVEEVVLNEMTEIG